MKNILFLCAAALTISACQTTSYERASENLPHLTVSFTDPSWTGDQIPDDQQCKKFGGNGATPALTVSGVPSGANAIIAEFNDESYAPLSTNGGHGKIGFWLNGSGTVNLVSVPGHTNSMPSGVFVEQQNRATGSYATQGYLPPCSGGKGNTYSVDVKAVYKAKSEGEASKLLAEGKAVLGKY